jgi:dCMP deaminase
MDWNDIKACTECTDITPCEEHEAFLLEEYIKAQATEQTTNTPEALIEGAVAWSTTSPDPTTKVGAFLAYPDLSVCLPTMSVNEFPNGVSSTPERWERPTKYLFVEHAERNAIFKASRAGVPTEGMTLVTTWSPCADCARAIIQAGIAKVIQHEAIDTTGRWGESIEVAQTMLREAGVQVLYMG